MTVKSVCLHVPPDISLYHVGPSLDLGPLPSVFYFSLSGNDSLCKDPFNQIVQFSSGQMIRFFSLTLPAHEGPLSPTEALTIWAQEFEQNKNPLEPFFEQFDSALTFALKERFIDPNHIAVAGLSRGAFVALHLAARDDRLKNVLALAPISKLHLVKEFQHLENNPILRSFDLSHLAPKLIHHNIRIHIGNLDHLVHTKSAFEFANSVAEKALEQSIRSPKIEFHTHPSIGHKGHGTPPEIFAMGAKFLANQLHIR